MNGILIGLSLLLLVVAIILLVQCTTFDGVASFDATRVEPFSVIGPVPTTGTGPFTPAAGATAWFCTFGRECEPGLTKCVGANQQYYCTKKRNCQLKKYNLKGRPINEPMSWFMRHV